MNAPMHNFRFGNRVIACAFPLPSLRPAPADIAASLHVTMPTTLERLPERDDWLHHWPDKHGNITLQLAWADPAADNEARTYLLRFPGLCDIRLNLAHGRVDIARTPATTPETLEHLLIDQALPRLLADLGDLVIHAGCVQMGTDCSLFLGQSGWGKSTLASLLRRHGHVPLSDDCALLDLHDNRVRATPTYPSLRLFDDSVGQTFDRAPTLLPIADYTGKRRVRLDSATEHIEEAVTVRALYLLNDPAQPSSVIAIDPISPASACMAMVEHGFRLDLRAPRRNAGFLQQAAVAARHVPAFALHYPRDFTQSQQLIARLEQHIATLSAPNAEACLHAGTLPPPASGALS